jgi:hypothetical protein
MTNRTNPMTEASWQPIETAPKDGTRMLAWWPHLKQPVIAWISQGGSSYGKWTFASFRFETIPPIIAPTHWMPLPEVPCQMK